MGLPALVPSLVSGSSQTLLEGLLSGTSPSPTHLLARVPCSQGTDKKEVGQGRRVLVGSWGRTGPSLPQGFSPSLGSTLSRRPPSVMGLLGVMLLLAKVA